MTVIDLENKREFTKSELSSSLLSILDGLKEEHFKVEEALLLQVDYQLFPAHILYLSVLSRSLEQLEGFLLLFRAKQYGNCIALLRMQMDSIMRFYGVMRAKDIHDTAERLCNGDRLANLKDESGEKMKDVYLHKLLDEMNPGFSQHYDYACGFIHFSQEHFLHLLDRSWDQDLGKTSLRLGSDYGHVDESDENKLLLAFFKYTNSILKLSQLLEEKSNNYSLAELKLRYRKLD